MEWGTRETGGYLASSWGLASGVEPPQWLEATRRMPVVPAWAVYERMLMTALEEGARCYQEHYCEPDGSLRYPDRLPDRDGVDDFYESFYNFPLLYLLGGSEDLLHSSKRHWEAITRQLDVMGCIEGEYERGYDWFHQGESMLFFYALFTADPTNATLAERVCRFADLYVNPSHGNYDAIVNIIRAPHNGGGGARWGISDAPAQFPWRASMARYGLPLDGVSGVATYDALRDRVAAEAMGRAIEEQMGRGDVAVNLLATSVVTLAFLCSGDERYRDWVVRYVDGWVARAEANGGRVPDNVGLSGKVGEHLRGRWFGGHYGWTWPHGLESVGSAVVVAGANACLLTGDAKYLEMGRFVIDDVMSRGIEAPVASTEMSQIEHWLDQYGEERASAPTFLVPHRFGSEGWFDYQPMYLLLPTTLWHVSGEVDDLDRLKELRAKSGYPWVEYRPFRNKHDAGHEDSWLEFLLGDNPSYPEVALSNALGVVTCRLDKMRQDREDEHPFDIHRWQEVNPVTTELLMQLTTGSPSPVYNGGLPLLRLRYFDAEKGQPGLPPDVAALVTEVEGARIAVEFVNTSVVADRPLVIQAGTFGEDLIEAVRYDQLVDNGRWPGSRKCYGIPKISLSEDTCAVGANRLGVRLPPGSSIALELKVRRRDSLFTL